MPSFIPAEYQINDPPRTIWAKLLKYLADVWAFLGGGGFPASGKGRWFTLEALPIAVTSVPQEITSSSTPCYKAIVMVDATASADMQVGGDAASLPLLISIGTAYLFEPSPGKWFDLNEMFIEGTALDTYSILYFTDP